MNKLQPVSFHSVEDLIDFLPEKEKEILLILRHLIFDAIPDCTEKLSYNVPYYYRHSRICFIWPYSVPWGKVKTDGVQLGFCRGDLLDDELNYLEKSRRNQVYTKTFFNTTEINFDIIKMYLFEAIDIDYRLADKHK